MAHPTGRSSTALLGRAGLPGAPDHVVQRAPSASGWAGMAATLRVGWFAIGWSSRARRGLVPATAGA